MHNDIVVAGLEVLGLLLDRRGALADDELLGAAKAVLAVPGVAADAARHLVGAVAGGQRGAAAAAARFGARARRVGQLARLPELAARHGPQDGDVDRDDADNGLAHAPPVHVEGRGVGAQGQDHADDGRGDDEQARAEKKANDDLPESDSCVSKGNSESAES